jgi:cytochrome b involved in lipid metabolism
MLGLAIAAIFLFVDKKGYSLRRNSSPSQHPDYQGQVAVAERELHNEPYDCWMEIHGQVYDLTEYAPKHPGGAEFVTDYCGQNATRAYDREHPKSLLHLIRQYKMGAAVLVLDVVNDEGNSTNGMHTASNGNDGSEDYSEDSSDDKGYIPAPSSSTALNPSATIDPPTDSSKCPVQYYSLDTVTLHDTRDDCWYVLYGNVYDLTSYVDKHPGGARRVFNHCGSDATWPYQNENKHTLQLLNKKVPHLQIGVLGAQTEVVNQDC